MSRRWRGEPAVARLILAAGIAIAAPGAAGAGPGEAGRGPAPAGPERSGPAGVDYLALIWYRRDDPLGTFRYQIYDVRKGEYTPAVDDWLEAMRTKYPQYVVRVRGVDLERERGATEELKVGSVIHRELLVAAAQAGIVLGGPLPIGPGPSAARRRAPRASVWTETPGAGGPGPLNPATSTAPFPVPYPRPHP